MCRRGPSKKELKELQKKQEEEMLALFNAVPKKDDGKENQKQEELDPDTGPTFTDITQEIEYQRANVVAKTKITDEVFQCGSTLLEGPSWSKIANGHVAIIRKGCHPSFMFEVPLLKNSRARCMCHCALPRSSCCRMHECKRLAMQRSHLPLCCNDDGCRD
jgi:hypothetical protein